MEPDDEMNADYCHQHKETWDEPLHVCIQHFTARIIALLTFEVMFRQRATLPIELEYDEGLLEAYIEESDQVVKLN